MIISFNFRKLFHFHNLTNGLQDEWLHNGIAGIGGMAAVIGEFLLHETFLLARKAYL